MRTSHMNSKSSNKPVFNECVVIFPKSQSMMKELMFQLKQNLHLKNCGFFIHFPKSVEDCQHLLENQHHLKEYYDPEDENLDFEIFSTKLDCLTRLIQPKIREFSVIKTILDMDKTQLQMDEQHDGMKVGKLDASGFFIDCELKLIEKGQEKLLNMKQSGMRNKKEWENLETSPSDSPHYDQIVKNLSQVYFDSSGKNPSERSVSPCILDWNQQSKTIRMNQRHEKFNQSNEGEFHYFDSENDPNRVNLLPKNMKMNKVEKPRHSVPLKIIVNPDLRLNPGKKLEQRSKTCKELINVKKAIANQLAKQKFMQNKWSKNIHGRKKAKKRESIEPQGDKKQVKKILKYSNLGGIEQVTHQLKKKHSKKAKSIRDQISQKWNKRKLVSKFKDSSKLRKKIAYHLRNKSDVLPCELPIFGSYDNPQTHKIAFQKSKRYTLDRHLNPNKFYNLYQPEHQKINSLQSVLNKHNITRDITSGSSKKEPDLSGYLERFCSSKNKDFLKDEFENCTKSNEYHGQRKASVESLKRALQKLELEEQQKSNIEIKKILSNDFVDRSRDKNQENYRGYLQLLESEPFNLKPITPGQLNKTRRNAIRNQNYLNNIDVNCKNHKRAKSSKELPPNETSDVHQTKILKYHHTLGNEVLKKNLKQLRVITARQNQNKNNTKNFENLKKKALCQFNNLNSKNLSKSKNGSRDASRVITQIQRARNASLDMDYNNDVSNDGGANCNPYGFRKQFSHLNIPLPNHSQALVSFND